MDKELVRFKIVRVPTKDLVTDSFQGLRNMFGMRLRGYENMLNRHISAAIEEMNLLYKTKWFRLIVNPLTKGSSMIIVYGEGYAK